ncbi:hypothetical protein BGZ99_008386 [Dissophora globulifera]|uniref:Uncharacterized protein n=1 Tax=Dissophora globulifera TaxID=979702 RepID=A0A9P6R7G1_9FUNG|nr:hypothetical protein BGZ99_008386 [Dissophora globulifera]
MKFNIVAIVAALTVVASVAAIPTSDSEINTVELMKRATCCSGGCGAHDCCVYRTCTQYGGPTQCGSTKCCLKYNC